MIIKSPCVLCLSLNSQTNSNSISTSTRNVNEKTETGFDLDLETKSIRISPKLQNDFILRTFCSSFGIQLPLTLAHCQSSINLKNSQLNWNLEKETFPFCSSCKQIAEDLVKLCQQLEDIKNKVEITKSRIQSEIIQSYKLLSRKSKQPKSKNKVEILRELIAGPILRIHRCNLVGPHDDQEEERTAPARPAPVEKSVELDQNIITSTDYFENSDYELNCDDDNGIEEIEADCEVELEPSDSENRSHFLDFESQLRLPSTSKFVTNPQDSFQNNYFHKSPHKDKQKQCQPCQLNFWSSTLLQFHNEKVHPVRSNVDCQHCGKIFKTKLGAYLHVKKVHFEDKLSFCEICSKGFFSSTALELHRAVHSSNKLFKCRFCMQKFRLKGQVRPHEERFHPQK